MNAADSSRSKQLELSEARPGGVRGGGGAHDCGASLAMVSWGLMVQAKVRELIATHGRLAVDVATISDDSSLYDAGLTSLVTVTLLLALEGEFDVEFPDEMLSRRTFQSISALSEAVSELMDQ